MDNQFSSIKLFSLLRDRGIGAVGTVRANFCDFSKKLAVRRKKHQLEWDFFASVNCDNGKVLAITWVENGSVQPITTVQNVGERDKIERLRKRSRLTATNRSRARTVFGESATTV